MNTDKTKCIAKALMYSICVHLCSSVANPLSLLLIACLPAGLGATEPTVRAVDVRGLQVGGTTTVIVDGDDLGTAPRLLLPFHVKQVLKAGATPKRGVFDVTLDGASVPGFYNLRVVGDGGVSLPVVIAIDALPQKVLTPKVERLPVALHGALTGSTVVSTEFAGKAGEKVIVEVEAQRLGSKLRPIVHLYDAKRRQIAWAWGKPGLAGDTRLTATLPAEGTYTVTVHDAEYAGGGPGHFRLKIGQWAFVEQVFPPVVGRDQKKVELIGEAGTLSVDLPALRMGTAIPLPWPKAVIWSGPRPFVTVSNRAEIVAKGDGIVQDLPEGPVGVSGRLSKPFAEDRFRIVVKPGSKVRLEAFAERLGSPLHVALVVRNEANAVLARVEEGLTTLDPTLDYTVPANTTAILVGLEDAQGHGGPLGVYRMTATPEGVRPDFRLFTREQRIALPVGGKCAIPVLIERRGYAGAVELFCDDLPPGVKVEGNRIDPGADGTIVTVHGGTTAVLTHWRGRAEDKRERPVVVADDPLERIQPWLATEIPLAPSKAKAAEFQIDWRGLPADAGLVPAGKRSLPVKVIRPATAETVRLMLLTGQSIPLVNNQPDPNRTLRAEKPVELAAKVVEGELTILVPAELASASYDVAIRADLLGGPDKRTVLATAYTPVRRMAVRLPLVVTVEGTRIEAKSNPTAATTVKVKGKVERREGLTGDVALTLTGLPPGASAAPVTVKAGTTDFALDVVLPANVPPGETKGVKVSGSAVADPKQPAVRVRSRDVELTFVLLETK
jgi:hypothetical protein